MTLTQKFKAGMAEKFRRLSRPALLALLFAAVPMVAAAPAEAGGRTARKVVAEGGPYESLTPTSTIGNADPQFRSLFLSWKKQDDFQPGVIRQGTISVPSAKPIRTSVAFTSGFGVRSDPFRGGAAMHAGIDLAGPIGTPIYATADGVVGRAEWANGYGNLVELDHGRGIATRYGHLSKIIVHPGDLVKRGDLIALMGSTGRSTGSHLHYEVRLDGRAVNPVPFLQSADYLVAMQNRSGPRVTAPLALGGPES
ncbi:M23 family metallopeptidase [Sphingomonas solaris]|uniref:M23 family metallopeptidase n=1 Tax=Alterirhizorhabdus solaris TaxID=2529389 RepID=A0A558R897_9SPHN|nr:M23 family metallopeptidase [Sphingomonas solaris]TVV75619.1 M23 family metallopeptidase [Sphingomonas solaris]